MNLLLVMVLMGAHSLQMMLLSFQCVHMDSHVQFLFF